MLTSPSPQQPKPWKAGGAQIDASSVTRTNISKFTLFVMTQYFPLSYMSCLHIFVLLQFDKSKLDGKNALFIKKRIVLCSYIGIQSNVMQGEEKNRVLRGKFVQQRPLLHTQRIIRQTRQFRFARLLYPVVSLGTLDFLQPSQYSCLSGSLPI